MASDSRETGRKVTAEYEYGMAKYQAETLPPLVAAMERQLEADPGDKLTAERLRRTRAHLESVRETIARYEGARGESV